MTFPYGEKDADYKALRIPFHAFACYCFLFYSPTQPEYSPYVDIVQGDVGPGLIPLVGEFWDSDSDPTGYSDIFWYGAGSIPDQQCYAGFTT